MVKQVNFDVSGGNDKITFLLGVNYMGDAMQNKRTDDRQVLLNFASTHTLNSRMKLDFRGTYTNIRTQSPQSVYGAIQSIDDFLPYKKLSDDNGRVLSVAFGPMMNSIYGIRPENNEINKSLGLYDQLYYPYDEHRRVPNL